MMAQQLERSNGPKLLKRCSKCGRVTVCAVFRAISPLLQQWTDETRPFDPEDLAMICREFIPASVIDMLKET